MEPLGNNVVLGNCAVIFCRSDFSPSIVKQAINVIGDKKFSLYCFVEGYLFYKGLNFI